MNKKRNIFLIILAFIVSTFFAIILTNYYINEKQKELLNSIYETTHKNIFEKTQNLINDKQNTSLAIAISLSKDETLYTHLKNRDFEKLNYIKIAKLIETNSKYKNIWIQILDSNLNSVYRSWTNIRGSSNFRPDLKKVEALKNISTSISAGLFNIGIKARTPIFDENNNLYFRYFLFRKVNEEKKQRERGQGEEQGLAIPVSTIGACLARSVAENPGAGQFENIRSHVKPFW